MREEWGGGERSYLQTLGFCRSTIRKIGKITKSTIFLRFGNFNHPKFGDYTFNSLWLPWIIFLGGLGWVGGRVVEYSVEWTVQKNCWKLWSRLYNAEHCNITTLGLASTWPDFGSKFRHDSPNLINLDEGWSDVDLNPDPFQQMKICRFFQNPIGNPWDDWHCVAIFTIKSSIIHVGNINQFPWIEPSWVNRWRWESVRVVGTQKESWLSEGPKVPKFNMYGIYVFLPRRWVYMPYKVIYFLSIFPLHL